MSGPAVSTRPARSCKAAADILSGRDPVVRRLVAQAGPVRVNPPTETHFAALVRAILYQRLAGVAARAIHGRLIAALGGEVTPERFLSLSSQTVRAVGLSANKAASMQDLATKVLDGSVVLDPAGLHGQGDDEIVAMLAGVRDIGTWTAQMFLMFQLRRLDVSPAGDLGVRKGFGAGVGDADADSQTTRGARRPVPALSFGRCVVLLARRRARGGAAESALTS
jgi:DNA-3-methyladenine glycosylase II